MHAHFLFNRNISAVILCMHILETSHGKPKSNFVLERDLLQPYWYATE